MKYQKYTGTNLRVDAGIVGGKALVRKATVNIFGGTVDLTTTVDLGKESMPMQASIAVAKFQPNELVGEYLSRWLPGLSVSSLVDMALSTSGELGDAKGILSNLTGSGAVDIAEGVLSLGQLPAALSAVMGDLNLDAVKFPKLNIPLEVADGAVSYNYALPAGKYTDIHGRQDHAGGGLQAEGGDSPAGFVVAYQPFVNRQREEVICGPEGDYRGHCEITIDGSHRERTPERHAESTRPGATAGPGANACGYDRNDS